MAPLPEGRNLSCKVCSTRPQITPCSEEPENVVQPETSDVICQPCDNTFEFAAPGKGKGTPRSVIRTFGTNEKEKDVGKATKEGEETADSRGTD